MEPAAHAFFARRCCVRATFIACRCHCRQDLRGLTERRQQYVSEKRVTHQALDTAERENGSTFAPKFGADGLLTTVVLDHHSGEVLVVAHMNADALNQTLETGKVTFWSRSRNCLWLKGETSGNFLGVAEVLVDCDQDALVIRAIPVGPACHTGARSCFYRRIDLRDGEHVLVHVGT
jgi:phosphoribosyl-AMP cyclohydrolase